MAEESVGEKSAGEKPVGERCYVTGWFLAVADIIHARIIGSSLVLAHRMDAKL